eukprot:8886417-Lingulodinium_polyedra.AAC.1
MSPCKHGGRWAIAIAQNARLRHLVVQSLLARLAPHLVHGSRLDGWLPSASSQHHVTSICVHACGRDELEVTTLLGLHDDEEER